MLNKPMPKGAYPVAKEFARSKLVFPGWPAWTSTFDNGICLRFCRSSDGERYCPMGLHPKAITRTPYSRYGLPLKDSLTWGKAVKAFADWWDHETSAKAALAEIERVKGVVA